MEIIFYFFFSGEPSQPAIPRTGEFIKEAEVTFIDDSTEKKIITIGVEVASKEEERNQGLMYREKMPENFGMLFIFPTSAPRSFWMKNTIIPLDIIFLDQNKRIIHIVEGTRPFSEDPIESYGNAMYVIEVNAGFTDIYNIGKYDVAKF